MWYDQQADIERYYRLFFFPVDNSIEMYDKKMNRVFLKRVELPSLKLSDLFVGAQVTIFARVLKIQEYGDIATARKQSVERESTFAMIKPDSYQNMGKIIDAVQAGGFQINQLKMSKFNRDSVAQFYGEHQGKPFYPALEEFVTSDVCIGMELTSNGAIAGWRDYIGPTNSEKAKQEKP